MHVYMHACLNVYIHVYIYMHTYNTYIYIIIHRQICFVLSELISVARQARFPKLGSKPGWLKRQSKILPLSQEETSASEGNLNGYESQLLLFTNIHLTATESSIHMKSLAYTLMATQLLHSLESSTLHGSGSIYIYIYIYIVSHRQICFVLSELISVARQAIYIYIYIY